jgi:hypothetical protein
MKEPSPASDASGTQLPDLEDSWPETPGSRPSFNFFPAGIASQLLPAWITTRLERDKSLLTLASAGIGRPADVGTRGSRRRAPSRGGVPLA